MSCPLQTSPAGSTPATHLSCSGRWRRRLRRGVDVGAHVGFPDRQGFGRRPMQIEADRARSDGDLPAWRAGWHCPRGRSPHDPYELPRRAREHGSRRRRARRTACGGRGAVRSESSSSFRRRAGPSSRRPPQHAASEWRPPSWPTAPATQMACSCRAECRIRSSTMRLSCCERVGRLLREGIVMTYDGKSLPMRPHSILLMAIRPGRWRSPGPCAAKSRRAAHGSCPISRLTAASAVTIRAALSLHRQSILASTAARRG